MSDKTIDFEMVSPEEFEGNYIHRQNSVMYDHQNGNISTVAICVDVHHAKDMARSLNLLDNIQNNNSLTVRDLKWWI